MADVAIMALPETPKIQESTTLHQNALNTTVKLRAIAYLLGSF